MIFVQELAAIDWSSVRLSIGSPSASSRKFGELKVTLFEKYLPPVCIFKVDLERTITGCSL